MLSVSEPSIGSLATNVTDAIALTHELVGLGHLHQALAVNLPGRHGLVHEVLIVMLVVILEL